MGSELSGRVAWAAVVAQTAVTASAFAVVFPWLGDDDPFDGSARDLALVAGIFSVNAALVIGGVLRGLGGRSLAELGWAPHRRPGQVVALGLAGALACAALVAGVGLALGGLAGLREVIDGFVAIPLRQRILCVLIGLGAGLCEETVFRGALQPVLVRRLGRPAGILLTAVVFSAYHLRFAPIGFAVKALFGALFGALRERTGSNWAPAIAHAGVWTLVGFS